MLGALTHIAKLRAVSIAIIFVDISEASLSMRLSLIMYQRLPLSDRIICKIMGEVGICKDNPDQVTHYISESLVSESQLKIFLARVFSNVFIFLGGLS